MGIQKTYDVIVIGAGPVGCTAATLCADEGLSTLLVEEHATIGYPVQCAGLLSVQAFHECRVSEDSVLNTISGARIITNNAAITFQAKETKAYVVDRAHLDREIAMHAAAAGSDILIKTYAKHIKKNTVFLTGAMGSYTVSGKVIIAADGPKSSIARMKGLTGPKTVLSGLQCDIRYNMDPSHVEIFPNGSEDFFAWIIPIGNGRARAGLAGTHDVKNRFLTFIKPFEQSCIHFVAGTIPLGVIPQTYADHTLITGDAAGFAKPTSGGGVYTGVRSARHAAATAIEACEQEHFDASSLSVYEKRWKSDFGRELALGYLLFKLRNNLHPSDIEYFIKNAQDPAFLRLIEDKGDMDRPSRLLKRIMFSPVMARSAGHILIKKIRDSSFRLNNND